MLLHESRRLARVDPGRRADPAPRPGPLPLGSRPPRRGRGTGRARLERGNGRSIRDPGGDRGGARHRSLDGCHRLGPDRRAVRPAPRRRPLTGRGAQSRRCGRDAGRPRVRPPDDRSTDRARHPRRPSSGTCGPGRSAPSTGPAGRGETRLRAGARPWRERFRSGGSSNDGSPNSRITERSRSPAAGAGSAPASVGAAIPAARSGVARLRQPDAVRSAGSSRWCERTTLVTMQRSGWHRPPSFDGKEEPTPMTQLIALIPSLRRDEEARVSRSTR